MFHSNVKWRKLPDFRAKQIYFYILLEIIKFEIKKQWRREFSSEPQTQPTLSIIGHKFGSYICTQVDLWHGRFRLSTSGERFVMSTVLLCYSYLSNRGWNCSSWFPLRSSVKCLPHSAGARQILIPLWISEYIFF
jgi:hypothetical protein